MIVASFSGGGGWVEKQLQDRGLGRAGGEEEERECYRLVTQEGLSNLTTQIQSTATLRNNMPPLYALWCDPAFGRGTVWLLSLDVLQLNIASLRRRRNIELTSYKLCALGRSSASTHHQSMLLLTCIPTLFPSQPFGTMQPEGALKLSLFAHIFSLACHVYCCPFLSILDRTDANDLSLTRHRKSPFGRARTKSSSILSLAMPQIETRADRLRKRAQEGLGLLRANANAGVPAKREMVGWVGRKDRGKEAPLEGGCESGCTSIGLRHSGMSGELEFLSVSCGKSDLRAPAGTSGQ